MPDVRIEIWSDIVCPWCYIGKRRLEKALGALPYEVEVVWRSYQLDPGAPREATETVAEHLGRKYGGGPAAGARMIDQMEATAAGEGLIYSYHRAKRANTMDAHRLLHLALDAGGSEVQGRLKERLLSDYFTQTRNVADHGVLHDAAASVGLDGARVTQVLESDEFADAVQADIAQAVAYGANGVPFFVIDQKYAVSGAQQPAAFTQVLERAWSDAHPQIAVVGDAAGGVCGPDGCAI